MMKNVAWNIHHFSSNIFHHLEVLMFTSYKIITMPQVPLNLLANKNADPYINNIVIYDGNYASIIIRLNESFVNICLRNLIQDIKGYVNSELIK